MKKITKIYVFEDQKKVVIKLNEPPSISLSLSQYESLKDQLKIGATLEAELEVELRALQTKFKIGARLENYLSLRPHSLKEIQDYLHYKLKLTTESVKEYLQELEDLGFIDDFSFANWYVEGKIAGNKAKQMKIKAELIKKGITAEIIQAVFAEINFEESSVTEIQTLSEKLEKRIRQSKPELRANQIRFLLTQKLAQRGYSLMQIQKALESEA